MTACLEDNFTEFTPTPGIEVKLSADLNMAQTRTLYGAESNNKVPVHWVHGDTISVYGADCQSGRKQADYLVSTINPNGGATPETGNDFAFSLDKVGAYGVQWGNETTSDFYAIYPSTKGTFGEIDGKVTVTTNIRTGQKTRFVETKVGTKKEGGDSILWVGTPYINDLTNPTMRDALMYAYTPNAAATDSYGNPKKVDLKFHPFSTVLKFRISGWKGTVGTGIDAYVSRIVLKAPDGVGIAGDCTFTFDNGVPTASNGTSNTIAIYPDYLPMGEGEAVEFYVFAIPQQNNPDINNMSLNENWTVTIETSNFGNHVFKLKPKTGNAVLAPAKIHKINMPVREVNLSGEIELPKENWMEYIPRNVYLSELSVPGSWYSIDQNYQGSGSTLSSQFKAGVRAFHLDCRLNMPSGTQYSTDTDHDQMILAHAGTDECASGKTYSPGTPIEDLLANIATLAKTKIGKEYVVVVLTVAEKPLNRSGGAATFGTINPNYVLPRIYKMLNTNKDAWNLFYRKKISSDSDEYVYGIDSNTTINDVLTYGNLVVIINANADINDKFSYGNDLTYAALISKASMSPESIDGAVLGNFQEMQKSNFFWGANTTDLIHYYHFAQRTLSSESRSYKSYPFYTTRKEAIDDIINQSELIYKTSAHNAWFQLGIGGYQKDRYRIIVEFDGDESHEDVAKQFNPYLLNWINRKLAKTNNLSPSPVGIVLMNYATSKTEYTSNEFGSTYKGSSEDLINAIVALNTQFTLERNHDLPEWPNGNNPYDDLFGQTNPTQNAAYAEVGEDAF